MKIQRILEQKGTILYRRERGSERSVPLYFLHDIKLARTVKEFRTMRQAVAFIKELPGEGEKTTSCENHAHYRESCSECRALN